ncbi:MAG: insulinase family protein [Prevotella sp.]|nr:insulinase family protein [Prevotella sp.]
MSKNVFRMTTVALLLICTCQVMAQMPKALEVKELKLSNDMTVWLNEDHSQPKIYGGVVVNAGAKDCPNTGIAHYFEHLMFKGTEEMGTIDYAQEKPWLDSISAAYDRLAATQDAATRAAIQKDINRLSLKAGDYAIPNEFNNLISRFGGSRLNAGTSYDFTFYHNMFMPQYLEQWCILNSDRLINPVFRMFQGELETVYEEKNMYDDDTTDQMREIIFKELFGTNGYGYPIIGSTENLKNPKLSEMMDFHKKYYVGCNMGLVLTGDFDAESIMPLLERTFGRIPKGTMPTHIKSPLPDILQERTVEMRLPIPLVSLELLVFKSPTDYEKDANAVNIAAKLLCNDKAGKLDSLVNEGNLMAVNLAPTALNDAGLTLMIVVPRLLSKTEKAETAIFKEIQNVVNGDFSDKAFQAQKQEAYHEALLELERIDTRFTQMVMVMSSGHSWQEYIDKVNAIDEVTRADVMAAAKKYYGAPFVRFKKKYGSLKKDKVSQPGYTPVVPKNKAAESEYAKRLTSLPVKDVEPRLLDFKNDATTIPLGSQAMLYTVKNPFNELFELKVEYNRGIIADPLLSMASGFMNGIGTDSLTRQELASALQQLGADLSISSSNTGTTISVTGVDKNFAPTMELVHHFLLRPKSNDKILKSAKDGVKAEEKSLAEENTDVFRAMMLKVMYGDKSPNLHRVTYKEVKKITGEELIDAFNKVYGTACDISYSGTLDSKEVETVVRRTLPVERSQAAYKPYTNEMIGYNQPTVYIYDMPKSRQTLFFTYDQLKALPTMEARVPADLFEEYFGGGMSSVLFQEVREFRSMAYTTQSILNSSSWKIKPNAPLGIINFVGTQGDKTMKAIALVDSLLHDMPLIEKNFDIAKQNLVNDINNNYPSFRGIGTNIATMRRVGFTEDSRTGKAALYKAATMDDMKKYFENNIKNNTGHRVLGIIGDKKKLNLKELQKYGQVVFLKEKDLWRK